MASDLPVVRVGEHCRTVSDTHTLDCEQIIFLNTSDILRGEVLTDALSDTGTLPGQAKKRVARGDILFSEIRPANGRFAIFDKPNPERYVVSTKLMVLRPRPTIDTAYLYLFLTSKGTISWLQHLAESRSGTFPQITFDQIAELEIPFPPLPEQRAIAGVLGALDDKIEVNRKTARVLEGIARAVFTSWFVDFDPVRRRAHPDNAAASPPGPAAARRAPGPAPLPADLAALFPTRLVDSPIGEVPEGWRVEGLDANIKFLNGLALQKFPPKDGRSLPVIKIAQLRKGDTEGADRASADLDPEYIVQDGDVLFSWSGSLECVLWAGGPGALNQHLFKVTSATLPKWFYYLWVHHHLPDFRHIAAGKATTMGHIQRHHLTQALVTIPTDQRLMQAMDRHFAPLIESLTIRAVQNRTLAALRDALLPKLISGELRIADAEKIVGRAV